MIILINFPEEKLIKCSECFKVSTPAAHHPINKMVVCKDCVAQISPLLLSPRDWLVYQTLQSLKTHSNYLVLTARKLKLEDKTVRAIACNLAKKGLKVKYTPKQVTVDGQTITELQHLILKTVLSDRLLIDACYIAKASRELNINKHTVMHHLEVLKQKGFNIPSAEERAKNLEDYVLKGMQSTSKPRSEFIKHIAKTSGFTRTTIVHIVKKLEDRGFKIRRGFVTEKILEVVKSQPEIHLRNLYKLVPGYHRKTVLQAVHKLKKEKKLSVYQYNVKKVIIKLIDESAAI